MASSLVSNKGLYIEEYKVQNITASANGGVQGNFTAPASAGYTPICVVGFESTAWETPFSKCILTPNNGMVYYALRNTTSSSKTVTLTFKILYISNGLSFTAS